jgi:predicted ArsR family transcriptional regulator
MPRPRVIGSLIEGYLRRAGAATTREIAHGLQMPVPVAARQLYHLERAGAVQVRARVPVEHCKRPVCMYEPAGVSRPAIFSDDWLR